MAIIAPQPAVTCCRITCYSSPHELAFSDDHDHRLFLQLLDALCMRRHWHCHAWCLMPDHYQLLLEVPGNLPALGIQRLNEAYQNLRRRRRRRRRKNRDFPCRLQHYRLVTPANLLTCARDIVLAPVATHLADTAIEWPWSSYRCMVGCPKHLQSLQTDMLLGLLYPHRHHAVRAWKTFVAQGIKPPAAFQGVTLTSVPPDITSAF